MDFHLGFLAAIAIRTLIVFVVVDFAVRLAGKRHTGEMNMYDLLVVLIMANAVQNAMTKSSGHVTVSLVAAGTLIAAGWLIAKVIARWPALESRLMTEPTVVIQDGRLLRRNLRREDLTEDEVLTAMRRQGLVDFADVRLAVLEMDGGISVVPKEHSGGS